MSSWRFCEMFNFLILKPSLMFRSSKLPQTCRSQETCMRTLSETCRRSRFDLFSQPQLAEILVSSFIVPLASHLCTIKFYCLSHLLVPGDLEEQEQCPNLDPQRRRRLKTSQKPPDYLHLQYLTIYFPVPLKRVFIYPPSKLLSQAVIFHAVCAPYSMCRNCCK